jgi:hypothetical protein
MFRMKTLRLGNFRSILEMLGPDGQAEDAGTTSPDAGASLPSGQAGVVKDTLRRMPDDGWEGAYIPLERLARLYDEAGVQQPPPRIAQADDQSIAAELHLSSARTGEDLRQIRRSFAMRNHPDRVPDWLREEATRRMRIANALIDRAMRDKVKK